MLEPFGTSRPRKPKSYALVKSTVFLRASVMLIDEEPTSNLRVLTWARSELNSVPTNSTLRPSLPATAVSRSLSKPVNLPSLRNTFGGASVSVPARSTPACWRSYGLSEAPAPADAPPPHAARERAATATTEAVSVRRDRFMRVPSGLGQGSTGQSRNGARLG